MRRAALLAALALIAAAPAAPPAAFSLREGRFIVLPPAGWRENRDAREDERQKAYGVQFLGPRGADGALSTISLVYYSSGNALFKGGAAEFLRRNLAADPRFVAPVGEATGPVENTAVGGLRSRRFTRRSREYLPPGRLDAKPVAIVERIDVVDAKDGFYVLEFKSSARLDPGLKPLFARVRASVRFLDAPAASKP